jgi:hypothetical protein
MASRAGPSSARPTGGTGAAHLTAKSTTDPVLRNALRYTISAREYALLHKYVLSRSRTLKRRAPSVDTVTKMSGGSRGAAPSAAATTGLTTAAARARAQSSADKGKAREGEATSPAAMVGADDYNARAIRHSIRVFLATGVAMKLWTLVEARLMGKRPE